MKLKSKQVFTAILVVIIVALVWVGWNFYRAHRVTTETSDSVATASVQFVSSTISADGTVTAQNQATLNFQTGGKLVRLPFKEGDKVKMGQTVAQLDTYALQRDLTAALDTYRSTRDSFDQTQQNSQDNLLQNQLTPTYNGLSADGSTAVSQAIQRLADESQAGLDNSVINVELANYALQLSTLTSPLNGILTHEDVTVAGVNIAPTNTFVVEDPSTMVFRANVPVENIPYVQVGSSVFIAVDGLTNKMDGVVAKVYPAKVTLANGQSVYQVDITSDQLKQAATLDESGTALITTNAQNVALVPTWLVLSGKYVWVDNSGRPELKAVTVGKTYGSQTEIIDGLTAQDHLVVDPQFLAAHKYQLL